MQDEFSEIMHQLSENARFSIQKADFYSKKYNIPLQKRCLLSCKGTGFLLKIRGATPIERKSAPLY